MYWPTPQDYNEAVQTPLSSFDDADLRKLVVETTPLGLPRCVSGNFASVYCLASESRKVAVRCFLQKVPDQEDRYSRISNFVMSDDLPYTVPFEYLKKGIKVRGEWFPVLKMHWVTGITLTQFVEDNLQNSHALSLLASYFKQMTIEFHRAGIAHGDLQHDNILIADDEIRLVDYDGMYVPALANSLANELGHRNYQHPKRDRNFFAPSLDNFSSWVIYASLKSLSIDPSLWNFLQGGDDCLLLRHSDFVAESPGLQALVQHEDARISKFASAIQHFLTRSPAEVPPIDESALGVALQVVPSSRARLGLSESKTVKTITDGASSQAKLQIYATEKLSNFSVTAPNKAIEQVDFPAGSSGWAAKSQVMVFVSQHLAPGEVVNWSSVANADHGSVWIILAILTTILLVIPAMLTGTGLVLFAALALGLSLIKQHQATAYRMCSLTDSRLLAVKPASVEMIPYDGILTVEETPTGICVVLLPSMTTIPGKNTRFLPLNDDDIAAFFKVLPKSVARRRL